MVQCNFCLERDNDSSFTFNSQGIPECERCGRVECLRCSHQWQPNRPITANNYPRYCPVCKAPYWWRERINK